MGALIQWCEPSSVSTMSIVLVRRLTPDDLQLLRDLRLDALREAPTAFGSTYAREATFSDEEWHRRLTNPNAAQLVCEDDLGPAGLVAVIADLEEAGVAQLVGMWVKPEVRGTGAAGSLVRAAIEAATALAGTKLIRLHVLEENLPARRLYERHGFVATGRAFIRDRDGATEVELEAELRPS